MPRASTKTPKKSRAPKNPLKAKSANVASEPQEFPISNSTLRAMYDAMVESRLWAQSRNLVPAISEATAVPTALVLHHTDALAAPADGRTLYPVGNRNTRVIALNPARVQSACEAARRKGRGAVIAICPEEEFDASLFHRFLALAHERRWPLVCIALTDRFSNPKSSVPEIDVDGHDAVAMFRVVSEALRRARNHRGPAIIHAHGATQTQLPDPLGDPLIRFQRYLAAKGLTTEKLHVVHTADAKPTA